MTTTATVPDAPTNVQASRSGVDIAVAFSAPANDGGSPITSYTVHASDGTTATGPSSPITVTGLTLGTSYTFTVVATNSVGDSAASAASSQIVPATVPDAPIITSATMGDASSVVSFAPGNSTGGLPILDYTVTAVDTIVTANGGQTATGASSPITVPNLINGDGYTFTVTARNEVGTSGSSGSSALVIPQASTTNQTQTSPIPNATGYDVTKKINLPQFIDELQTAVNQTVNVASTQEEDGSTMLWIAPSSLPSATINTVIANHVANPNYGVPASEQAYLAVQEKVLDNPDVALTATEQATAINGMILRLYGLVFNG